MVHDYREYVNGNGYGVTFPSPIVFIKNNLIWIMQQEILIFRDNINSLLYFDWFGPLAVFLLLVFLPSTWKKFKILYIYAFIIILVYTSAWSALFERSRHFTATYLLLLIPLSFAFEKLAQKKVFIAIVIIASILIPYLIFDVHRIIWSRTVETIAAEDWGPINRKKEFEWIDKNISKNDIISSTNPEMVYLFTDRPGINTPTMLNNNNYFAYVNKYHVKYFLTVGPGRDPLLDSLANLKEIYPYGRIYEVQ